MQGAPYKIVAFSSKYSGYNQDMNVPYGPLLIVEDVPNKTSWNSYPSP